MNYDTLTLDGFMRLPFPVRLGLSGYRPSECRWPSFTQGQCYYPLRQQAPGRPQRALLNMARHKALLEERTNEDLRLRSEECQALSVVDGWEAIRLSQCRGRAERWEVLRECGQARGRLTEEYRQKRHQLVARRDAEDRRRMQDQEAKP